MRPRRPLLVLGIAAIASIAAAIPALAICPPAALWQTQSSVTQVSADTPFGTGLCFYALGSTLYAIRAEPITTPAPQAGGTVVWSWSTGTGATIQNFPSPVVLSSDPTKEYLFVAAEDGKLYKINAQTGASTASVDTKRSTCGDDKLHSTPAVQLYAFSNSMFQSDVIAQHGSPDDVVFITTSTGCGDHTHNRVLAYWASNLTPKWQFNPTGAYSMDYASDACAIDYASNRLYCGTHQDTPSQNSAWAINSLDGGLQWSAPAGSIHTRPQIGQIEFYCISMVGMIQKRNPVSGALLWQMPNPVPAVRNLWVEFRSPSPTWIFMTGTDGKLYSYQDGGISALPLWAPVDPGGGIKFSSMPVFAPPLNKLYIGRDDGRLQQFDGSGAPETVMPVGLPGTVFDPSLDLSDPTALPYDRLNISTTTGSVARFCIPWETTVSAPVPPAIADLALAQNAPNPFSENTRIDYRLPFDARVEIDVYDVAGHRVRALARATQPTGRHAVAWNGLDDEGRTVTSGLYFYRLRAVGADGRTFERSKKIQLVR